MSEQHNLRKFVLAFSVMLTSGVGFLLLGMLIDIKIISKYDYTPISFTVIFLLGGVILGVLLVFRFLHRK